LKRFRGGPGAQDGDQSDFVNSLQYLFFVHEFGMHPGGPLPLNARRTSLHDAFHFR
jgi:hypothetical protein